MPTMQIYLNITAQEYAAYYDGSIRYVITRNRAGQTVQFPASILRAHVTHVGIKGKFELEFDHSNKLINLHRLHGA